LTRIVLWVTAITAVLLGLISYLFGFLTQQITSASVGTVAGILAVVTVIVVAFAWLFSDRFTGTRT
jgi:drug/metabolite transporter (DMT)-like permease